MEEEGRVHKTFSLYVHVFYMYVVFTIYFYRILFSFQLIMMSNNFICVLCLMMFCVQLTDFVNNYPLNKYTRNEGRGTIQQQHKTPVSLNTLKALRVGRIENGRTAAGGSHAGLVWELAFKGHSSFCLCSGKATPLRVQSL